MSAALTFASCVLRDDEDVFLTVEAYRNSDGTIEITEAYRISDGANLVLGVFRADEIIRFEEEAGEVFNQI